MRIYCTVTITATLLWQLYHCRPVTFMIWTNAAIIDHAYPRLTVSIIEFAGAVAIAALVWCATGFYEWKAKIKK